MYEYSNAKGIVRLLREAAGLTQRELGERAGVTQPVIARLESAIESNPSVKTIAALAAAAGFRLRVMVEPIATPDPVVARYKQDVDRSLLRDNLRRPVEARLQSLGEWQEGLRDLAAATREAKVARRRRRGHTAE